MVSTRRILAFVIVVVLALGLVSTRWLDGQQAVVLSANAFFVAYLTLALADLGSLDRKGIQKVGSVVLIPSLALAIIVLATVVCAITALFMLINAEKQHSIGWLLFALLAVPLGWATVHTMMALHYARRYWRPGPVPVGHGLDFPGDDTPDGWDFLYFSFVIGMAAQTADVSITDKPMRRIALVHSAMSYFFNAVLVAAAVNLAVAIT
jgi:uncharacterized membrane protein